jgi:hypothetical protein
VTIDYFIFGAYKLTRCEHEPALIAKNKTLKKRTFFKEISISN